MNLQCLTDHVTFGHGPHLLLQVLLLEFASIFLTFQFSNSLIIQISNTDLFTDAYTIASAVFFAVLILFTAKMGKRTFSPSLHQPHRVAVSVFFYLVASGVVITFGYVLLILATTGRSDVGYLDYVFSVMLTTLFAALLAVGYHARVVDKQPARDTIIETITAWQDSLSWVNEDDQSHAKQDAYDEFTNRMDELSDLLSNAKTVQGKQLRDDFEEWQDNFETHSKLTKETIIKGQDENKNQRIEQEHQELESIRRRLRIIAGG